MQKKSHINHIELFKECDVAKIKVCPPDKINLFKYSNKSKPVNVMKDSKCVSCDQIIGKF